MSSAVIGSIFHSGLNSIKIAEKRFIIYSSNPVFAKRNNDNDERIIIGCNACLNQNKGANIRQTFVIYPIQAQRARSRGQPEIGLQNILMSMKIGQKTWEASNMPF